MNLFRKIQNIVCSLKLREFCETQRSFLLKGGSEELQRKNACERKNVMISFLWKKKILIEFSLFKFKFSSLNFFIHQKYSTTKREKYYIVLMNYVLTMSIYGVISF